MGIKYKTSVNKFPQMQIAAEGLNGKKVKVGVFGGENAWLAGIHEYGCNIKVTPKMRAYLHRKGLHLKATTTHIRIPERAFLRNGHDTNIDKVLKQTGRAVPLVLEGRMSEQQLFDLVGQQLSTRIKTYARDLKDPPNHPYTIEEKGSSNPLVDSGDMIEHITWQTE